MKFFSNRLPLFGLFVFGCANAEERESAYMYKMVELSTDGGSVVDPNQPYRELWEATALKAENEILRESGVSKAYRGATYFGRHSDSYMVYAITPDRGIFYYLPPGPYGTKTNVVFALPRKLEACRLEIEWAKVDQYPWINGMASLQFVSKDCQPFPPEEYWAEEMEPGQSFNVKTSESDEEMPVRLVNSSMRSGTFDVAGALAEVLKSDSKRLDQIVPLAGINEDDLIAGIADDGTVYLLMEGWPLSYNQRCVFSIGNWDNIANASALIEAQRTCNRIKS